MPKGSRGAPRRGGTSAPVDAEILRQLALSLPAVEEGTSYGTLAFRVKGKFFCRLREDGDSLVLPLDFDEREILMGAAPETFYITEHYRNYPAVLVRLSRVDAEELRGLLEESWRRSAPKRLLADFDARGARSAAAAAVAQPESRRPRRRR